MTTLLNLSPDTMEYIHQGRAKLVLVTDAGTPAEREQDMGVVTVGEVEMGAETTKVYSSNFPTRRQIGSLSNETSMTFNFTTQSITRDVRIMALMGLATPLAIPSAANFNRPVGAVKAGDRIPLGRTVNGVAIDGFVAGTDFRYEPETRTVVILNVPQGKGGADTAITGNAPAVTGAVQASVGTNPSQEVYLRLYGVEADKAPFQLDVLKGTIRPSKALGFIGENDPIAAEFAVQCGVGPDGSFGLLTLF